MSNNKTNNYEIKRNDGVIKRYNYVSDFVNGFAAVKSNSKWGFIDEDGNEICPIKYSMSYRSICPRILDIRFFHEGFAVVAITEGVFLRYGYINTKGKEMTPLIFKQAYDFLNGRALVIDQDSKFSIINKEFKIITNRPYDDIRPFYNGCAVVKYDELYGFINESGTEIVEPKYEYLSSFGDSGYAQFTMPNTEFNGVYFVDTKGKEYFSPFNTDEMIPLK